MDDKGIEPTSGLRVGASGRSRPEDVAKVDIAKVAGIDVGYFRTIVS
jgi:hypothetical protein